jgi:AcrR family transcriptional regulator
MESSGNIQPPVRRPTQERGRRRVDAILDAAAATLVEGGTAGFTMHGVAARANTSIGSMYHFFPDGESVLRALGERHMVSLGEILLGLHEVEIGQWAEMPLARAVNAILDPILGYMEAHPDLLALPPQSGRHSSEEVQTDLDLLSAETFEKFVGARALNADVRERELRAKMVMAMTKGVATRAAGSALEERPTLFRELKVAVTAYLNAYEPS